MFVEKKRINFLLVLGFVFTLFIPSSLISNLSYAAYQPDYDYDQFNYPAESRNNNDEYYNNDYDKEYYYEYPLKENKEVKNTKEQIQKCEECFFSELDKLDHKYASKILHEIDREFGDLERLCYLISNKQINIENLEQILLTIVDNIKNSYSYNNNNNYYDNSNNIDSYNEFSNNNYPYASLYDNGASEYYYQSDQDYILDEQHKQELVQNILYCLFKEIPLIYVVWFDDTPGNNEIFFAKSTDGGETFGDAVNVSNNSATSLAPSISVSNNTVYVVWQDSTSGNFEIFFAKSTDGGETFGDPINISNNPGVLAIPQLTVLDNNVYVVWQDGTSNSPSREIFFAKSTDGGETFGDPVNVSNTKGFSVLPQMVISNNIVYVVWSDDSLGYDEIFFAKSNDGGETFGDPINVSINNGFSFEPSIAFFGNTVYIIWSDNSLNGNREIFFAKSTDGGETFGDPVNVSNSKGYSTIPEIFTLNESIYVIWDEILPGEDDIFFAKSNDGGETFGDPINVSNNPGSQPTPKGGQGGVNPGTYKPSLIAYEDIIHIIWQDGTPGNYDIFLSTSSNQGETFEDPINVSNTIGFSGKPDIAFN